MTNTEIQVIVSPAYAETIMDVLDFLICGYGMGISYRIVRGDRICFVVDGDVAELKRVVALRLDVSLGRTWPDWVQKSFRPGVTF